MDSRDLAEEAAPSASDSVAPAPLVAAGEAAQSADLAEAGADRGNWADLSEAPADFATASFPEDLIDLGEPLEEAAFGASENPPEEERFSALELLDPVVKTEPEEPATYEDILASLEGPPVDTGEVAEPLASGSPEAEPVADHPTEETQDFPLDSEEVSEEVKEEPDFSVGAEPVDSTFLEIPVFGDQDPPRSVWDDYSGYRGPQPKASGPKPSVFVRNTSPEEPASLCIRSWP